MQVKHVLEKEDGTMLFQGELTGQELAFVVETGLNYLFAKGALPLIVKSENPNVVSAPESVQ